MAEMQRCDVCNGFGKIMGGGMLMHDCDKCNGAGKLRALDVAAAKQTDSYKAARKRLKAKMPKLSNKQLDEMLEKELKQLEG